MKIKNYILSALVALPLVAGLASCSESGADYDAASIIAGNEVYFASVSEKVELSTDENVAYVSINRVKTDDAISVPLKVTSTSADIKPANEAKFAAGENVGKIAISYDPAKVEPGVYDTLTIAVNDPNYVTPYGASAVTVLIGQAEPWVSLGWGKFGDFFMADDYVDVKIEQNQLKPNQYRVVDPYKDITGKSARDPYFYFTVHSAGDMIIESKDYKAPFDGFVTYEDCNTGYYYGDGYGYYMPMCPCGFSVGRSEAVEALNCVEEYFEDGTPAYITLTSVYGLSEYGGAWNESTTEGLLQVVMPGYELTDFSAEVEYAGKFINTEDQVFAVANITLGADVSTAKYGIYAGDVSMEGLEYVEANGVEIDADGEYKIPMPEDAENGKYTIYVVTCNESGESMEFGYETFKYQAGAVEELTWTPVAVGTWEYSLAFCNEDGTPYYDEGLVISACDQDESLCKISHLWGDVEFVFSLSEDGIISFEDQPTGVDYGSGEIWALDLSAYEGYEAGYFEDGVFHFNIYYGDDKYNWGEGFETFTLTGEYSEGDASKARKAAAKKHFVKKNAEKATPMNVSGVNRSGKNLLVSNGVRTHKMSKKPIK